MPASADRSRPPKLAPDLLAGLEHFLRTKFYPDHAVAYAKDRPRLLKWVLLYPAAWLNKRGVTLPPERYRAILTSILLDAVRFGQTSKVTYLPAYLRQVVQSHFAHHGDELYAEAKSLRNLVDHAVLVAGQARGNPAPDPVRDLAAAASLLRPKRSPKFSAPAPKQPTLFDL